MSVENKNLLENNNTDGLQDNDESMLHVIEKWDDLDIDPNLLRGIYAYGYEKPSPIQSKAIYPIMKGRDIIAQAQSGTGKTATFSIGALSRVDIKNDTNQILILSPTHELSRQTATVINSLGCMLPNLRVKTAIGGASIDADMDNMKVKPPHIIVGCPGRVYDMLRRHIINSNTLKLVILDEADEMLSSGFKEQIFNIFQYLNNNVQIALFSATLPSNINQITEKILNNPVKIVVILKY